VARDRQRAKARKQRQAPQQSSRTDEGDGLTPEPDHLHRENVPGPWEHGGEVDRVEAELVAGAGGEPAEDPDAVERDATGDTDTGGAGDTGAAAPPPPVAGAVTAAGAGEPARGRGGNRFLNFLRACWAELQRVQWPDRRQVGQATMVVLAFVVIAGAFLGAADFVAQELVDLIL
jgi:preprotein translocase subunit SecE